MNPLDDFLAVPKLPVEKLLLALGRSQSVLLFPYGEPLLEFVQVKLLDFGIHGTPSGLQASEGCGKSQENES